jgi:hypothetical protein
MKTYNGLTIEQIENNLPLNMIDLHKKQYIDNCKEVIKNQLSGYNLGYNECIKNTNFNMVKFYLNN